MEKFWQWVEKILLYKWLNEHRLFGKIFNREVLLYLLFGALTTLVSWVMFKLPNMLFDNLGYMGVWHYLTRSASGKSFAYMEANVISWICAVTFAFLTNRRFVFDSQVTEKKSVLREAAAFYGGRLATLLVETAMLYVLVTMLSVNEDLSKIFAMVVVTILNYFISKWFVFRKPAEQAGSPEETELSE